MGLWGYLMGLYGDIFGAAKSPNSWLPRGGVCLSHGTVIQFSFHLFGASVLSLSLIFSIDASISYQVLLEYVIYHRTPLQAIVLAPLFHPRFLLDFIKLSSQVGQLLPFGPNENVLQP